MDIQCDGALISDIAELQAKQLQSKDSNLVGRVFHESLLRQLLRKGDVVGQAFAVTDTRVLSTTLNFAEHTERRQAARESGRFFAAEANADNEKLLFIGATSLGINRGDNTEVAFTFIQDLQPLHDADTQDEFVSAIKKSEIRLFIDELSDNGKISVITDGDICLLKEDYEALAEDERKGYTTAENALLLETFVGASSAFKYCREAGKAEAAAAN